MTYRESIQIQIAALQQVYDHCASLNDVATLDESKYFSKTRGMLMTAWSELQQIDNSMSSGRASMTLRGNYEIHQITTS